LIVEHADQTLKTPEDVKEQLGVPFLGMVPDTARPGKTGPALASPLILRNPRSALAEAYRVIRTNLIFSAPDATGRTMVVSSVNPSEGKSTNVLNIAASLAHNDARVLVIDADLRRPTIHQHFNVPSTPGLSDLIVGKSTREEAIRATPLKGLDVLPCGYIPPNPAELLGSARMRELVEDLRQKYDWILVDAPPILAMADAPVIASMVDGLLLIVAAERTQRAAALRALDQISGVGGSLVGVLLNRVNLQRNSFYFGQYYGEYYTSYYGAGTALAGGADASPQRRAAAPARRA
jgi:capsular exopolysaccharide synthesis family protein